MTPKQRKCIEWICEVLEIRYCGLDSVSSASRFISEHIKEAKTVQEELQASWDNPVEFDIEEW